MNQYQLRIYTMVDVESLNFYKDVVYPRHLDSFKALNITPHGFWTNPDMPTEFYVLVSYQPDVNMDDVDAAYMVSPGFLDDVRDMDLSRMVSVRGIKLVPSTGSPLI